MRHLFVSPHLDDIALSCGGVARQRVLAGDEVFVATVCTADAPTNWRASPAAHHVHAEWRLGNQPYPLRRREDDAACALLGARAVHLNQPDAVYRFDAAGAPYYTNNFMGGQVHPADQRDQGGALERALLAWLEKNGLRQLRVIAPLGLGGHVDHLLTRRVVERVCKARGLKLSYFEDFPYGERIDVLKSPVTRGLTARVHALTPAELDARVRACLCYPSQLEPVFHLPAGPELNDAVTARITTYASRIGGERLWM